MAVGAVLLYHTGVPLIGGGFIGVDVFYVISGFLISGLLLREFERSGRISLVTFYSRRARRLLPAALVVILATVALSALKLSVLELRNVTADAAAAALYVSNYRFALAATDYLAAQDPSPLLHYWSLGVEEQFYLFWPLLVMLSARLLGLRRLWWVVVTVGAISFGLSVWLTGVAQPWAFFSLPTRAWELALGALVAVGLVAMPTRWPVWAASLVGAGGLALIGASMLLIRGDTPFPGVAALAPAIGALLVIVAGSRPTSVAARALATRPARWVGGISYSLYLWHWPILVLMPLVLGRNDLATRIGLAVLCVGIAWLSTRFVESPFRAGRLAGFAAPRTVAIALGLSVAVAIASLATREIAISRLRRPIGGGPTPTPSVAVSPASFPAVSPDGSASPERPTLEPGTTGLPPTPSASPAAFPGLPPPLTYGPVPADLQPSLLDADNDVARSLLDGCQVSVTLVRPRDCAYGVLDAPTTVALLGDSHAAHWLPAIEALAAERNWRILPLTKASCPPINVVVWLENYSRPFDECLEWQENALAEIEAAHPAIVFVSMARGYSMVEGDQLVPFSADPGRWQTALAGLLQRLRVMSGRTVLIADTPRPSQNPPRCLAGHELIEMCPSLRADMVNPEFAAVEAAAVGEAGVTLVRPDDWLCDANVCPLIFGNYLTYRDNTHITATFSALLAPLLGARVDSH